MKQLKQTTKVYLSACNCSTLILEIFSHHHLCSCIPPLIFHKSPRLNAFGVILEKLNDQFDQKFLISEVDGTSTIAKIASIADYLIEMLTKDFYEVIIEFLIEKLVATRLNSDENFISLPSKSFN